MLIEQTCQQEIVQYHEDILSVKFGWFIEAAIFINDVPIYK